MLTPNKWLGLFGIVLFVGCSEKDGNNFTVKGTVKNANADVIFLEEAALGNMQPVIVDSAKIEKDGSFTLQTNAKEENLYVLRLTQQMNPVATVINDASTVTVAADLASTQQPYSVKGSSASQSLIDFISKSNTQLSSIYAMSMTIDSLTASKGQGKLSKAAIRQQAEKDSIIRVKTEERQTEVTAYKNYVSEVLKNSNSPSLSMFVWGSYQS